ncbi:MAG: hypothetical protein IJ272_05565 [Clostridia bacterium]|nr:hypothetical protein [Clostridia bacterium]
MIRTSKYITLLLIIIVIMLLIGLGVAIYYVLDLDWFDKKPVDIYNELQVYQEQLKGEVKIEKEMGYDITKRTYNIVLESDELKVVVYKDGTVGITMLKSEKNQQVEIYKELIDKETKLDLTNIVRAYEVIVSKDATPNSYIILLDADGNLYKLANQELMSNGKYTFVKIEGLAKIIDVRQITNEGLVDNTSGINAIAIDEESNELLLTDYLIK